MTNVTFSISRLAGATNRLQFLLVHSDAGKKEQFASTVAHLAASNHAVVAFDRRGHGQSSMPTDGRFGYSVESGDVFDVADIVGYERFVLIGHSGGGDVAFKAANERPERIAGLLLIDPGPDPMVIPADQKKAMLDGLHADFAASIGKYYRGIAGPDPLIADEIVATALATPPASIIGITEYLDEFRPREFANSFRGPAHAVIQPQFDVDGALHRLHTEMTHEGIADAGHWIHMVAPEQFAAALDRFLERVR